MWHCQITGWKMIFPYPLCYYPLKSPTDSLISSKRRISQTHLLDPQKASFLGVSSFRGDIKSLWEFNIRLEACKDGPTKIKRLERWAQRAREGGKSTYHTQKAGNPRKLASQTHKAGFSCMKRERSPTAIASQRRSPLICEPAPKS